MISQVWNSLLVTPLLNILFAFYKVFGNMGIAIIAVSIVVKILSHPQTIASFKLMKKQKDIMPELDKLKKKFGHDKKKLAEAQMQLYKQAGINPASGCLNQILPILTIIALYSVIRLVFDPKSTAEVLNARLYFDFLRLSANSVINSHFLYMDLAKPDKFYILPVLAAFFQFISSKMMTPSIKKAEKVAEKTSDSTDNVMYNMQEQMVYTMPIVFLIVGLSLPSGVVLNILVTTLFTLVQQYLVLGFGGLAPWLSKLGVKVNERN